MVLYFVFLPFTYWSMAHNFILLKFEKFYYKRIGTEMDKFQLAACKEGSMQHDNLGFHAI